MAVANGDADSMVASLETVNSVIDAETEVCVRVRRHMSYHVLCMCRQIIANRLDNMREVAALGDGETWSLAGGRGDGTGRPLQYHTAMLIDWLRAVLKDDELYGYDTAARNANMPYSGLCNARCFAAFDDYATRVDASNLRFKRRASLLYGCGSMVCTGPWEQAPEVAGDDGRPSSPLDVGRELAYVAAGLEYARTDLSSVGVPLSRLDEAVNSLRAARDIIA